MEDQTPRPKVPFIPAHILPRYCMSWSHRPPLFLCAHFCRPDLFVKGLVALLSSLPTPAFGLQFWAVYSLKWIVQRLTDFLWVPLHSTHDGDQWTRFARIFYVLKESIDILQSWYETKREVLPHDPSLPILHPRFFPSIDNFLKGGHEVGFQYETPLEHDDSLHFSPISYSTVTKLHMTSSVFFDGNLLGTPPSSPQI